MVVDPKWAISMKSFTYGSQ